jgi:hypothetical protein
MLIVLMIMTKMISRVFHRYLIIDNKMKMYVYSAFVEDNDELY